MNICPKCGLPLQACVCEEIVKTEQRIHIQTIKKKFGKINTIVSGFQGVDLKSVAKDLKQKLACGGTAKNKIVELQGDHRKKIRAVLSELGFPEDTIDLA